MLAFLRDDYLHGLLGGSCDMERPDKGGSGRCLAGDWPSPRIGHRRHLNYGRPGTGASCLPARPRLENPAAGRVSVLLHPAG